MFKEILKQQRAAKGLTQEALAALIPCSRTLVSKWESGASYPVREDLLRLSEIFAIPVSELIGEEETTLIAVGEKEKNWRFIHWSLLGIPVMVIVFLFIPMFVTKDTLQDAVDPYVYTVWGLYNLVMARRHSEMFWVLIPLVDSVLVFVFGVINLLVDKWRVTKAIHVLEIVMLSFLVFVFLIAISVGIYMVAF
jgi:transcriptional regulator with XRE-family HTH domain